MGANNQEAQAPEATEFIYSKCGHIDLLSTNGLMSDEKRFTNSRYIDVGSLIDFETGKTRNAPVLHLLKEGKNAGLTVKGDWVEVKFCPLCGESTIQQEPG